MIGSRLKNLRTMKGITQEEMAQLLSVTPQAISRWENNVSVPDTIFLIPIADLFGVSVDYILREPNESKYILLLEDIKSRISFDSQGERSKSGYYVAEGTLKNDSDYNLEWIDILVVFKDADGRIVDSNDTSVSVVCSHGEKPFRLISFCKKDIVTVEIRVKDITLKDEINR